MLGSNNFAEWKRGFEARGGEQCRSKEQKAGGRREGSPTWRDVIGHWRRFRAGLERDPRPKRGPSAWALKYLA